MLTPAYSLCVFCIRKRRRDVPVRRNRPIKPPALERSEARERLQSVAEVAHVLGDQKAAYVTRHEEAVGPDNESVSVKEWWAEKTSMIHEIRTDREQRDLPFNLTRIVTT